jgi:hypothetical protein
MHCTESLMLLCFFTKVLANPNLRLDNTLVYSCPTLTRTFPGTERVLNHLPTPHILIPFIPCLYHFTTPPPGEYPLLSAGL